MEFVDRQLTCMDCSQPFVFTAGEQEFYDRKGFKEEPKRCKNCRDARKTRKTGDLMSNAGGGRGNGNGNGHHSSAYGGGGNNNSNNNNNNNDDDNIGNRAPSSASPSQSRGPREVRDVGGGGRGARGGGGGGGGGGGDREMFDATCAQCGVATRVPFRPVAGRPVYCRDCYGKRN